MAREIEVFVEGWVAHNVHHPAAANLSYEVDRLAAKLTGDARAMGISGGELHRLLGDIDDYLTDQLQQVQTD